MTEYRVVIPDEIFAALEWQDEGLPAICMVNQSLANFEPKPVFAWHLSIIVEFADPSANGLPASGENELLGQIGQHFDLHLKSDGNAMFLARITWNGTRQFLYRVYDPEVANTFLTDILENGKEVRPLDYKMEHDVDWTLAKWYLQNWEE
ncbi:DUF695 domain-containing protein [Neorhodopirellula lusitana]|uniref:DUF695 domain-containing protein n=1 Tax=Neorhodopirellula lusitana TaxID=445327 RepID=UPI00384F6424